MYYQGPTGRGFLIYLLKQFGTPLTFRYKVIVRLQVETFMSVEWLKMAETCWILCYASNSKLDPFNI